MDKLVAGPEAAGQLDITRPVADNIEALCGARGCRHEDITVCILERPRHERIAQEVCATGARIKLISDGDVAGAVMAASPGTGVDLLLRIGGTPEGVIAVCAVKCLGGLLQCRLAPTDAAEAEQARAAGHNLDRVLTADDLVAGDDAFFAFFVETGITDGELVEGVRYGPASAHTDSVLMCARSGTVHRVHSTHRLGPRRADSAGDF